VQGDGQFHHAEAWRQVTAVGGAGSDDQFPDLRSQAIQFGEGELLQLLGPVMWSSSVDIYDFRLMI